MTLAATGGWAVRAVEQSDWASLHRINQAAVPGVNSLTRDQFEHVMALGAFALTVVSGDAPAGFMLVMTEGLDYPSLNYRWLSARYDAFAYVDRVAVAPDARDRGVGQRLYQAAVSQLAGVRPMLLAEVNLAPPNPGSLRFHERNGFTAVGERWSDDRSKGVIYLARALP